MSNLKVKPLEFWQQRDHDELIEYHPEVPDDFNLIGRDGFYCLHDTVWFEYEGRGYFAFHGTDSPRAHFQYDLDINDEAILPHREAEAMVQVLKTCQDASVRKAIYSCLRRHEHALGLRTTYRTAMLTRRRILK